MSIKIYKSEKESGLDKLIKQNSVAYLLTPKISVNPPSKTIVTPNIATANNIVDLYYMESILASIGWNANDDVFAKEPTWNARNTPVDKPFNYMHDEKDIIGHMIASAVIDEAGKILDDTLSISDVPDKFDIVVQAVMYKSWSDTNLQERMDKILAEIDEGKWFVSMECLFSDFDYAIITPDGQHKVIARSDESSFLTKSLRVYGGTGEYDGNKIGRLLKDFTFSGKGLVDNPANKRSDILNDDRKIFNGSKASINTITKGINDMTEEILNGLKQELAAAREENKTLKSESDKANATKISALEKTISELKEDGKVVDAKATEYEATIATLTETVKAREEAIAVLKAEIDALKAEIKTAARTNMLIQAGIESDEAKALLEKFGSLNDDMFSEVVAMKKDSKESKKKEDMSKEDKTCSSEEDKTGESKANDTDVSKLETEKDAALSVASESTDFTLRTKASEWFSGLLKNKELTVNKENK
jgi:hypothetical protein